MQNHCQHCGACCAIYKVPVKCSEIDDQPGGTVPIELTLKFGKNRRIMLGTEKAMKRCIALVGTVGADVMCQIYDQRPSTCRNFPASWSCANGGHSLCDRARCSYGLIPFEAF